MRSGGVFCLDYENNIGLTELANGRVMLQINISERGSVSKVTLSGIIDENSDLAPLLEIKTESIEIECSKVVRINSVGIERWRNIFSEIRGYGRKLVFTQVSPVLVDVQNFISSFIETAEELSVCVPYDCNSCNSNTIVIIETKDIAAKMSTLETTACVKCGKSAEMTEIPEEYFGFIIRGNKNKPAK